MDLYKTIAELYEEKRRVESAIEHLEQLQSSARPIIPPKKRGRKGMTPAERQVVSERMRMYWSGRRQKTMGATV